MRIQITAIILCLLLANTIKGYSQDVIFLHHSTGAGVYSAGNVASWITSYNTANNKSIQLVERNFPNESIWGNYPYDYWKLWVDGSCNSGDPKIECLNTLATNYDLVIFKHCFPGAAILPSNGNPDVSSSAQTIDNYKLQYRALRNLMDSYPTTKFMVWTLAPLHRLETSAEAAQRAYEFVQWVKNEWLVEDGKLHPNIIIFDFFSLVAELGENPTNGVRYCLKYDYEISHTILDSHPNTTANQYVGPIFAQAIANAFTTTSSIPVTNISVTGANGATSITTDHGVLQLSASILPSNASNKTVTWSFSNVAGQATISSTGLVTAINNGTVTARALANDGSGVSGYLTITISNQIIPVTGITVTGAGGASVISAIGGTLQLSASVLPANATSKEITWSIINGTGQASINSIGLVTAIDDGTVTAKATAKDGSGASGTLEITISSQVIPVSSIVVNGSGGATTITTDGGTLQLSTAILPANATNKNVTWTITNSSGQATINTSGLVTAVDNGTITVKATANDGSGVFGTLDLTLSNQYMPVSSITVTGAGGVNTIANGGTLQLNAAIYPENATDKTVAWSVVNGTGEATISSSGLITAVSEGSVTAKATANDGSSIAGTLDIIISKQLTIVESIEVYASGNSSRVINKKSGTLQMVAEIIPEIASIKSVNWSIENHTGSATIDENGLVTALSNGWVEVIAAAIDGSNVSGYCTVAIINQSPVTNLNENVYQEFNVFQSSNKLFINSDYKNVEVEYCSIYTIQGILIHREKITEKTVEIDISLYLPGIYIISLSNSQQAYPLKVAIH